MPERQIIKRILFIHNPVTKGWYSVNKMLVNKSFAFQNATHFTCCFSHSTVVGKIPYQSEEFLQKTFDIGVFRLQFCLWEIIMTSGKTTLLFFSLKARLEKLYFSNTNVIATIRYFANKLFAKTKMHF